MIFYQYDLKFVSKTGLVHRAKGPKFNSSNLECLGIFPLVIKVQIMHSCKELIFVNTYTI